MSRKLGPGLTMLLVATIGIVLVEQAIARPSSRAVSHAQRRHVTVKPSTGYPGTYFHVSFRAPDRTGEVRGQERYYEVSASGSSSGSGCASEAVRDAGSARAHARVRVTLKPGPQGWCAGTFHGTVSEQERPVCPPRRACPKYIVLLRKIGRFSFTVQAQPPGADATAPTFGGLDSATACTPGPQRPRETTPYHLAWHAAHDAVTPSSQIVYDIFMSSKPGGENYSQPTWTTTPGATRFQTPGLPSHASVYFVVRGRDQAGNEDSNQIEREGVDPCL